MKRISVNPDFWHQGCFQKLSSQAKLLYLYFKTNSRLNIIGIGQFSPYQVALDTGIEVNNLDDVFKRLFREIMFVTENDVLWVWLRNELSEYTSPKIMQGAKKLLATLEIPDEMLDAFLSRYGHLLPSDQSTSTVALTRREVVAIRDNFKCQYCGKDIAEKADMEIDHVVPRAKGGSDAYENLFLSCRRCNQEKLDLPPEKAAVVKPRTKLFGKADALKSLRSSTMLAKYRSVFLSESEGKSESR